MLNHWHAQDRELTLHQLGTDPVRGLEPGESTRRLREHGPNLLEEEPVRGRWRDSAGGFLDPLVLLLIGAAAACAHAGAWLDAAAVGGVALANGVLGSLRERRRAGEAGSVGAFAAVSARVVRGGRTFIVPAADLVAGDLAVLAAGERVPADLRLLTARGLFVDESGLTGEPLPTAKDAAPVVPVATPLAERANMLYAGTAVASGGGMGVVVATGGRTELGAIARLCAEARPEPPPLSRSIAGLGRRVAAAGLLLSAGILALQRLRGAPIGGAVLAAAGVAVATVPAGLPGLVLAALAAGARRLARRGVAVRSLAAVDTLGAIRVIGTDATGTFTRNEPTVRELVLEERVLEVTGSGYAPEGEIRDGGRRADPASWGTLGIALRIAALCSNARLAREEADGPWRVDGDPTAGALLCLAAKGGVLREGLLAQHELVGELPSSAQRRRITVLAAAGAGRPTAYSRGAPELVLAHCLHHRTPSGVRPLSPTDRERVHRRIGEMEGRGLRALGLAYREDVAGWESAKVERAMVWVGLVGMTDPPLPEAPSAISDCRAAGIRPVIMTGGAPGAALTLAGEIGALRPGEEALAGEGLDRLTPEALASSVDRYGLFARVTGEHKLRIVRAWRRRGWPFALNAHGVSDAPALREADLGVRVGRSRTGASPGPIAVEAAGEGLHGILAAILEGRAVAAGLRASVGRLVVCSFAAAALLLLAAVAALPAPLLPVQVLWVSLVVAALAGSVPIAPGAAGAGGAPRRRRSGLFGAPDGLAAVAVEGGAIALAALAAFLLARRGDAAPELARTHALAVLAGAQLLSVLLHPGAVSPARPRGLGPLALAALLLVGSIAAPGAGRVLGTVPLAAGEWLRVLALSLPPLAAAWLFRRRRGL